MDSKKIPVTIVTGFLGAGKTSLLNAIIKNQSTTKFAIIENEFGELAIDGGLLLAAKENIYELSNGCICCSLQSEFTHVIERLLQSPYPFNHLLIETTGIANPLTVIKPFLQGDSFPFLFEINAVVCMIDAKNMHELSKKHHEIHQQIALSDILVINKIDCVSELEMENIHALLRQKNPLAKILTSSYGNINTDKIVFASSYQTEQVAQSVYSFMPQISKTAQSSALTKKLNPLSHTLYSEAFEFTIPFDVDTFSSWIRTFVRFNHRSIYRIKGVVSFANLSGKYVLQSVNDIVTFDISTTHTEENTHSKLVFIGNNIQSEELKESLNELLAR